MTYTYDYPKMDVTVDGEDRDVRKNPATASWKASKASRLDLIRNESTGEFKTVVGQRPDSVMNTVFENGKLLKTFTFPEVRENARKALNTTG